jgi:hypothetical protein
MKLCPSCDRHLFGPAPACPFCGAAQATTVATGTDGALARLVLGLAIGAAACGSAGSAGDGTSTGTDDPTTTTAGTSSGSSGTTTSTTLDDGADTTTIAESSSSTDDVDDSGGSFYALRPDGGGGPLDCDPFAQDCPPDEKCVAWAEDDGGVWNGLRCAPVSDEPDAPGEPCTVEGSATSGIDSCERGSMCFHVDPETSIGTCVSQCTNSLAEPMCPAEGEVCVVSNDDVLALCLTTCDPQAEDCPEGLTCSAYADTFVCNDAPGPGGQK